MGETFPRGRAPPPHSVSSSAIADDPVIAGEIRIRDVCDYWMPAFTGHDRKLSAASTLELHTRQRLEIAVPNLFLVGRRPTDAFQDAQGLTGVHRALLGIERAVGGKNYLVAIVEGEPCMGRRYAAEHCGVGVEVVLEIIERPLFQPFEDNAEVLV